MLNAEMVDRCLLSKKETRFLTRRRMCVALITTATLILTTSITVTESLLIGRAPALRPSASRASFSSVSCSRPHQSLRSQLYESPFVNPNPSVMRLHANLSPPLTRMSSEVANTQEWRPQLMQAFRMVLACGVLSRRIFSRQINVFFSWLFLTFKWRLSTLFDVSASEDDWASVSSRRIRRRVDLVHSWARTGGVVLAATLVYSFNSPLVADLAVTSDQSSFIMQTVLQQQLRSGGDGPLITAAMPPRAVSLDAEVTRSELTLDDPDVSDDPFREISRTLSRDLSYKENHQARRRMPFHGGQTATVPVATLPGSDGQMGISALSTPRVNRSPKTSILASTAPWKERVRQSLPAKSQVITGLGKGIVILSCVASTTVAQNIRIAARKDRLKKQSNDTTIDVEFDNVAEYGLPVIGGTEHNASVSSGNSFVSKEIMLVRTKDTDGKEDGSVSDVSNSMSDGRSEKITMSLPAVDDETLFSSVMAKRIQSSTYVESAVENSVITTYINPSQHDSGDVEDMGADHDDNLPQDESFATAEDNLSVEVIAASPLQVETVVSSSSNGIYDGSDTIISPADIVRNPVQAVASVDAMESSTEKMETAMATVGISPPEKIIEREPVVSNQSAARTVTAMPVCDAPPLEVIGSTATIVSNGFSTTGSQPPSRRTVDVARADHQLLLALNEQKKQLREQRLDIEPMVMPRKSQPLPPEVEEALSARYARIPTVEERAYQILLDLGMIECTG